MQIVAQQSYKKYGASEGLPVEIYSTGTKFYSHFFLSGTETKKVSFSEAGIHQRMEKKLVKRRKSCSNVTIEQGRKKLHGFFNDISLAV